MNKYLLEIGTEELPYKFIPSASEQLKAEFASVLDENKIKYGSIETYGTPRRIAVIINDISEKQEDVKKEVKGPNISAAYDSDGNLTKAALGFAAKNGIESGKLFKKDGYIYAAIEQKGKSAADIIAANAPEIILKLKGAHFMRWADLDIKFQRPIRWIVSIFNSNVIEFEFAKIKAGNMTRGHRSALRKEIVINHPDEYLEKLESVNVIADVNKRRERIVKLSKEKAAEIGADIVIDKDLLEEVTFITEYPVPVICSFDEKYLQIPDKVSVTVMAVHQRYFPLYKNGKLLNKFTAVTNFTGSNFENIKAGNERVVAARLEDAVFFVHEDTQKPLSAYIEDLKGITFQKGMGSLYDKTQRIVLLSKYIANELHIPSKSIERTALLSKADLASKLVFEFTELQGFIGSDYALKSGEPAEVSLGIKEHYFPLNADSKTASGIEGQVTGIADKIDTITAVFASGKKVSGSADPLGARRAALGILKTIIQKDLKINLANLIKLAIDNAPVKIEDKEKLYKTISDFITDRLVIMLSEKYSNNVLEACRNGRDVLSNIQDFVSRLDAVSALIKRPDFTQFNEGINRIIRIILSSTNSSKKCHAEFISASHPIEPPKQAGNNQDTPNEALFNHQAEKELYNAFKDIDENKLNYERLIELLLEKTPLIAEFFDKVLVMDKDERIKQNRLTLLNLVKSKFDKIADFSRI